MIFLSLSGLASKLGYATTVAIGSCSFSRISNTQHLACSAKDSLGDHLTSETCSYTHRKNVNKLVDCLPKAMLSCKKSINHSLMHLSYLWSRIKNKTPGISENKDSTSQSMDKIIILLFKGLLLSHTLLQISVSLIELLYVMNSVNFHDKRHFSLLFVEC